MTRKQSHSHANLMKATLVLTVVDYAPKFSEVVRRLNQVISDIFGHYIQVFEVVGLYF